MSYVGEIKILKRCVDLFLLPQTISSVNVTARVKVVELYIDAVRTFNSLIPKSLQTLF